MAEFMQGSFGTDVPPPYSPRPCGQSICPAFLEQKGGSAVCFEVHQAKTRVQKNIPTGNIPKSPDRACTGSAPVLPRPRAARETGILMLRRQMAAAAKKPGRVCRKCPLCGRSRGILLSLRRPCPARIGAAPVPRRPECFGIRIAKGLLKRE